MLFYETGSSWRLKHYAGYTSSSVTITENTYTLSQVLFHVLPGIQCLIVTVIPNFYRQTILPNPETVIHTCPIPVFCIPLTNAINMLQLHLKKTQHAPILIPTDSPTVIISLPTSKYINFNVMNFTSVFH